MGAPACYAGRSEQWRVQLRRKAEHPKHGSSVEVHVSAKLFFPVHHFFELLANRHPILFPGAFSKVSRDLSHRRYAGIAFLVNAMAKSHDFALGSESFH